MILALSTVLFGLMYYQTSALLDQANARIDFLVENQPREQLVNDESGTVEVPNPAPLEEVTELLEWGINQGASFRFGETALDGERAQQLAVLVDRLRNAGFVGTILVGVHLGRYCMNVADDGSLILPPGNQPVEACQQLGWPDAEALIMGEQQTLPFANTIALATREEGIRFEIVSEGSRAPRIGYPLVIQGLTAGEWNDVAARNNRVEVRIVSE